MNDDFSLGIDFGSNSVRIIIVNVHTGSVEASVSVDYKHADKGVYTDPGDVNVARQDADDYWESLTMAFKLLRRDDKLQEFDWDQIGGIGVDATGSTPIPVNEQMVPVGNVKKFERNLNAKAWMWKDHSSEKEAQQITRLALEMRPEFLKACGGKYSSEWFWAKVLHCLNVDPEVFSASYTWIEFSDYIPAVLTGVRDAKFVRRNACAAGHKSLYNDKWGGYPDVDFIAKLNPELLRLRETLSEKTYAVDEIAGYLDKEWADEFGLSAGIPVAMGALDAHIGAIGSGVNNKTLVKIIGTSTCDIIVGDEKTRDIQGVSGIAEHSVLPGFIGIEAGQSAVGDIFKWFVVELLGKEESYHNEMISKADDLAAGESGLLGLDWNNGNRDVLSDPNLRGLILGQSLQTKDYEIYRALIEATAYGAKRIVEQLESAGVVIDQITCCGGIPQKNPLFMQIYADVLNRPVNIAESKETVALGAAMTGALVYFKEKGQEVQLTDLQKNFCKTSSVSYTPTLDSVPVYDELYKLYLKLHDAFGMENGDVNLFNIMKQLIQIKNNSFRS